MGKTSTITAPEAIVASGRIEEYTVQEWADIIGKSYSTTRYAVKALVKSGDLLPKGEGYRLRHVRLVDVVDEPDFIDEHVVIEEVVLPEPVKVAPSFSLSIDGEGNSVITFVLNDDIVNIGTEHPQFARITEALIKGDDVTPLLDPTVALQSVAILSERTALVDGVLYFDGQPVNGALVDTIQRYFNEGREVDRLVRFLERLQANPDERSREVLFTWNEARNIAITEDGCFVGYKAVNRVHRGPSIHDDAEWPTEPDWADYPYESSSSGFAIVDGVDVEGRVPNRVGSVVAIPRELVLNDPDQACSVGLHVGDYAYASDFANVVMDVKVDPADVVSVHGGWKMRVCKYEVLDIHDDRVGNDLTAYEPDATFVEENLEGALEDVGVPSGIFKRFRARLGRKRDE